ncbi:MAG: glycosyl transferase, group 1 family protein [Novosphingobium sp.]|nr:glycosyl transferase, group 1 family protein [Novosphingobium sp.]
MLRVLSLSTLFPNPARPSLGPFVASQMQAVAARGDVDLVMVNPLGIPPWPLSLLDRYAPLREIGPTSRLGALSVHHPRFTLIPQIGAQSNPARIAAAVLPLARRLHAQKPFDLVDAQFFFPDGPAAAQIAAALGLPLTIKARGADIHHWGAQAKSGPLVLAAARQAAGLLAVSEALKADMTALGMPAERITVHYTGLDHARFRRMERSAARAAIAVDLGVPTGGMLLATTGALIERKGQRLVIQALAELGRGDVRLAFAGKGEDEPALRALAEQLGLADRVHFLGQVGHDRLPQLLAAADAMVLPSASEGLANAWVEALACGTPLVIPPIGGAREVVRDYTAGRIAERTPEGIAAALRELLGDPPAQAAVAANAARFSWEANAEALVGFWREVAA